MLLRPSSPAPWPGGSSHPCARCGEPTAGIAIGDLCPQCWRGVRRRAARIARWVAIGTTFLLAVYIILTVPPDRTARLIGAIAVAIWYVLTSLIARRVATEWLK